MDSYDFVDSVKAEKANALARYRRFTNITKLFQLIEVFVGVALISWSSTRLPSVFKLSGEYLLAFSSYLMNQHVVFLVGNVIVVVCYVLSRQTEAGNESSVSGVHFDDGKYSHLDHQKTTPDVPNAKPVIKSESPVIESESPVIESKSPIRTITVETESPNLMIRNEKPEATTVAAIKQAAKRIERFQRTQSDKLKIENPMKARPELRRSVTEKSRSSIAVTSGDEVSAVDRLSNEEFRIAVEAFISKQQRFLKQQSMVEI